MYIVDARCISPQNTFDRFGLEGELNPLEENRFYAQEPDYMNLIPLAQLRRMGKAVRMGIGAGLPLVGSHELDGIIIGSAFGGLEDCTKFLNQIVEYNEGSLTPTQFVQSTPNAVAGTLGLMSANRGYNITHVNDAHSFENCLIDVQMLLNENQGSSYLFGSFEELSDANYYIDYLAGLYKKDPVPAEKLFSSATPGTVAGEGTAMFVVSGNSENALCKVSEIRTKNFARKNDVEETANEICEAAGIETDYIDTLIIGRSGDIRNDDYYDAVMDYVFPNASVFTFKNVVGEYSTVTSFALWQAVSLIQDKPIPSQMLYRAGSSTRKRILIYNQYKEIQHSFILVEAV